MTVLVGTRTPAKAVRHAAMGLGLPPTTPKSAIIRAALALFHGLDPNDYLDPPRTPGKNGAGAPAPRDVVDVNAYVPENLARMPEGVKRSTAIRIGLALANDWDRSDAEEWARSMRPGRKPSAKAPARPT